jgi:hypothetical protein
MSLAPTSCVARHQKPRPETISGWGFSYGMGDEGLEPPTSRM